MIGDVTLLCAIRVRICSGETILKMELVAPRVTSEALCKFLPVITTREPSGPLVGEMRRISGRVDCATPATDRMEINAP